MSKKVQDTGKKIQGVGCLLSAVITLPILGLVLLGPVGLVLGSVVGGLIVAGMVKQAKEK